MKVLETGPGVWVATGEAASGRLTPADLATARGRPAWRARQILAGRALLRDLLAEVAPGDAGEPVVAGHNGKPVLAGRCRTGVSISHDGDHTVVAVAPGRRVGVDVQVPPPHVGDSMVRRCAARYTTHLHRLPETLRHTAFTEIWTVQEACVKAEGTGIGGLPWTIDVPPYLDHGDWRALRWRKVRELIDVPVACAWEATP
ncbi:4'-phosphopantetheinyl transferase family protein [Streptomyces dubilierae]|uniref:4-phosphopantetheinyl transferase n=1 Tax=Streptomyces dubilierae TaxID=3075533 RepID=A0ABU2PFB3_9ACTN|nr:4'-phosphopantetheinyl transferase superfamily protein [Streptomyces sp. DSM 41921]MDT0390848.1 4-phosphopantetheinyl transferase [Streptomyces sp. DSM 41921]